VFGLDVVVELNLTLHAGKLHGILHADGMSAFQYCIPRLHNSRSQAINTTPLSLLLAFPVITQNGCVITWKLITHKISLGTSFLGAPILATKSKGNIPKFEQK